MNHRAWIFSFGLLLSSAALVVAPAHAQLFGESDEDKAARKAHEDGQDARIDQINQADQQIGDRVKGLEDKVQSLTQSLSQATGANEELNHQIGQLNEKLDRQQKDFAYRLCMLSAQQLGAAGGDQGLNCAATASGAPPPAAMNNGQGPGRLPPGATLTPLGDNGGNDSGNGGGAGFAAAPPSGRRPGTLGTLSSNSMSSNGPPLVIGGPAPAGNAGQFDMAMNLLGKAQYAEASAGFRAYADANPDDQDLSPQAIYWIGNIAFVQQDYPTAARTFAELLKKYPDATRSPDGMLKLGQSLLAEGQTSGGCTTLALLSKKYPKASASTVAAATGARKASCSK